MGALGTRRFERLMETMLTNEELGGLNGSPFTVRDPDRIYLEEYFAQKPGINADLASETEATREIANRNFEVLGTNASSDDVTFATTTAGLLLQPDGANGDQVIILPHLDTNQTAWSGTKWGTENQVQWECCIRTDAADIDDTTIWAGLKLTNTQAYATDDDQAYFVYGAEDDDAGALTTNANLHFVYSVGGTDYITDLGITIAAATNYRLGIQIDSSRQAAVFVDGEQYNLVQTATAGGAAAGTQKGSVKSLALTNDVDLIPYVGIMNQAGTQRDMVLFYEKMSRILFE